MKTELKNRLGKFAVRLLVALLLLGLAVKLYAADADKELTARFYRGNLLYEQASYDDAIAAYNDILTAGFESGPLYYNLGNVYMKKGALGKALASYEQARRFMPRDRDLDSNYRHALSLVKLSQGLSPQKGFRAFIDAGLTKVSLDELTILLFVLYCLGLAMVGVSFVFRLPSFLRGGIVGLIFAAFIGIGACVHMKAQALGREAVVIADEARARFEPREDATEHFTVSQGMKLEVLQCKNAWCKIRRADVQSGWIQR